MFERIVTLYDKFSVWILGGLLVCCLGLSVGCYVYSVKLDSANSKLKTYETKLEVSNTSIKSLEVELSRITETLKENERVEKERQENLHNKLKVVTEKDKPLFDLENKLKQRGTTLNCAIPKDIADAWNSL